MMQIGLLIIGDEILSGRRQDKHFAYVIQALANRDLELAWVRYVADDETTLIQNFREILSLGDVCFSFGGIGATPDDKTRQAVAAAHDLPIVRHEEAVIEIETQFGDAAYPNRILMADLPKGANLIPNPINRVPGFSLGHIHCLPGFPEMAWPMLEWVLDWHYPGLKGSNDVLYSITIQNAHESELIELMNDIQAAFPQIRLSSLPRFLSGNRSEIEMAVKGEEPTASEAFARLKTMLLKCGLEYRELGP
jgi:molybdopterin-biosynthesis enzyme MoeA-like protein